MGEIKDSIIYEHGVVGDEMREERAFRSLAESSDTLAHVACLEASRRLAQERVMQFVPLDSFEPLAD